MRPAFLLVLCAARVFAASTAQNTATIELPPAPAPTELRMDSPFGINTAFRPGASDLEARLKAMQTAGLKWGRQDFTWKNIERTKGEYSWEAYDRLVEQCHHHGLLIFGNLAYEPAFHDPRTAEGVQAYAAFARAAAERYKDKVDFWQIWNEPNGGFWKGTPEQYAALLAASGKAIHEANPKAKVLGLNMA